MAEKWDIDGAVKFSEDEAEEQLDIMAEIVRTEITVRTPVDSGDTRQSNFWEHVKKGLRRIFNNSEAAPHVEFGTVPHVIEPVNAKALAFQQPVASDMKSKEPLYRNKRTGRLNKKKSNETTTFAKRVHHPGTPAQPFFRMGIAVAIRKIRSGLR